MRFDGAGLSAESKVTGAVEPPDLADCALGPTFTNSRAVVNVGRRPPRWYGRVAGSSDPSRRPQQRQQRPPSIAVVVDVVAMDCASSSPAAPGSCG